MNLRWTPNGGESIGSCRKRWRSLSWSNTFTNPLINLNSVEDIAVDNIVEEALVVDSEEIREDEVEEDLQDMEDQAMDLIKDLGDTGVKLHVLSAVLLDTT